MTRLSLLALLLTTLPAPALASVPRLVAAVDADSTDDVSGTSLRVSLSDRGVRTSGNVHTFTLGVRVGNPTGASVRQHVWIEMETPDGTTRVVFGPAIIRLRPGQSASRTVRVNVRSRQSGVFEARVFVGRYPSGVQARDRVRIRARSGDASTVAAPGAAYRAAALPDLATLAPPFPNPAPSRATVRYGLPESGPARVAVRDVLGREVAVLTDGPATAGWHEVAFDGSGLPAGVYVVTLDVGATRQTQRVTLSR